MRQSYDRVRLVDKWEEKYQDFTLALGADLDELFAPSVSERG